LRRAAALALSNRVAQGIVADSAEMPSSPLSVRLNGNTLEETFDAQPQLTILMLMREFYPLTGGYQNQALRLAQELLKRNIRVYVVTHRHGTLPAYEVYKKIEIHRVSALQKAHLGALSFLASCFWWAARNRHSFHLIHANRSSSGLIAGLIGFVLRKKVLYKLTRGDEIDIKGFRRGVWGRLKLFFLKHTVEKFVAITQQMESDLKRLGIPVNKIIRISNGISFEHVANSYDSARTKSELGWPPEAKVATFVGRLVRAKGVDWLLEVWRDAVRKESSARLLIIGEGAERAALEAQARVLGISDTVVFAGAQKDVSKFLQATQVFVLPSRLEGIANALLEAMSLKLAVIVADDELGGNREVIDDRLNGFVVKFGDNRRFVETLVELLKNGDLRSKIGQAAKEKIEKRFSIQSVAAGYHKVYRELSGYSGPSHGN
jgi:glycosyltransferase involved in cell wall biosynthesis